MIQYSYDISIAFCLSSINLLWSKQRVADLNCYNIIWRWEATYVWSRASFDISKYFQTRKESDRDKLSDPRAVVGLIALIFYQFIPYLGQSADKIIGGLSIVANSYKYRKKIIQNLHSSKYKLRKMEFLVSTNFIWISQRKRNRRYSIEISVHTYQTRENCIKCRF